MSVSTLKTYGLDPCLIIRTASMHYYSLRKPTLFVEGPTDDGFFKKYISSENTRIKFYSGKERIRPIAQEIQQQSADHCVCVADLDYDRMCGDTDNLQKYLIYIQLSDDASAICHDLECLLLQTDALRQLLIEYGLDAYTNKIRTDLVCAGAAIGAWRFISDERYRNGFQPLRKFGRRFVEGSFYIAESIEIDERRLADCVFGANRVTDTVREKCTTRYNEVLNGLVSKWELCNGHDLTEMLAMYITCRYRAKGLLQDSDPGIGGDRIERELRLASDRSMFRNCAFWTHLQRWQERCGVHIFI